MTKADSSSRVVSCKAPGHSGAFLLTNSTNNQLFSSFFNALV